MSDIFTKEKDMAEKLVNRVADLTLLFWVIKILSTTVGETAADFVNADIGLGLIDTTLLMGVITIAAVVWNFRQHRYYVPSYWSLIVMMSIEGTPITDLLVDGLDVSLLTLDAVFSMVMVTLFFVWYRQEGTLSIHKINNRPREIYYWLIVLIAFAVGTAYGDSMSEYMAVGYQNALVLFGLIFVVAGVLYRAKMISGTTAFWLAFIVTRPIGASLGDLLIQTPSDGGLGMGVGMVNVAFFAVILASVYVLMRQKNMIGVTNV